MNKPYFYAVVALFLVAPGASAQQNNPLPKVQNSYMQGSTSPSAATQAAQAQAARVQQSQTANGLPRVIHSPAVGTPGDAVSAGQFRNNPQPQQQMQQIISMPTGKQCNGLPVVKTSRYCGTPGEDMRNNTVRSAAVQARMPRVIQQAPAQKPVPSGPTYSYEGGYDYKAK